MCLFSKWIGLSSGPRTFLTHLCLEYSAGTWGTEAEMKDSSLLCKTGWVWVLFVHDSHIAEHIS